MEDYRVGDDVGLLEREPFHAWAPAGLGGLAIDDSSVPDAWEPSQRTVATLSPHPQELAWAVVVGGLQIGLIEIHQEGRHVARIKTLRVHPEWQQASVLARVVDDIHRHCWNQGYLKLILDSGAAPPAVRHMLERRGFQLVRHRCVEGREILEYYVDLYFDPRAAEAVKRS